ncbi:hypothetical protein CXB51_006927 [Gossypium anomalum]|uniref:DUF7745 domain-containing protein n=1 Tax=Gossypium anomalum TaxID=47600 RepID=A0A8J5YZN2_9ROSI|nr:hypothetical protein CXB51_006927 [Gossypium anomalum]
MESEFLDKVEDNAVVRMWSEKMQLEKGDRLAEGYTSGLSGFTRISGGQVLVSGYGLVLELVDKVCSKAVGAPAFVKKLMSITGMSEQWVTVQIQQKGNSRCILWVSLRDLVIAHLDTKRKVDVFALSIYGLVMFPKDLRHFDEVVADFFDRLDKGVTTVPEEDIEWRAPWFIPDEILYRCGSFDWVPLLGIWGAAGYAPLLVLRQYKSRQFIPMTHRLVQSEFAYKEKNYKKKVQEISDAWKQTRRMKRLAIGSLMTHEYKGWLSKRVNDNIP